MEDNEDEKTPKEEFELSERFIWKWHPHGWLTALLVLLIIILLITLAK